MSNRETLLLGDENALLLGEAEMFEEIASNAVQTLIFIFWSTLAFVIIWGALWIRAQKRSKVQNN